MAAKGTIADADGVPADANGVPTTFTYQWVRADGATATDISAATSSTYMLGADDIGKKIKVKVSFTDTLGSAETRTSDAYPSSGTVATVPDGSDDGNSTADETGVTVSSLINGTEYAFEVRAVNSAGEGAKAGPARPTPRRCSPTTPRRGASRRRWATRWRRRAMWVRR